MVTLGDTIGRYRIDALVGEGGMGQVFRAVDETLQRNVAIKVVRPTFDPAEHRNNSQRLLKEARAVAAIGHPNIVAIFDVGEHEGTPYIVMEYLEGRTLRDHLDNMLVPVQTKLRWLKDTARALVAAHKRQILHRDIKPSNVFVTFDGIVKVLDFGIAKSLTYDHESVTRIRTADPVDAFRTATGALVGTPLYIAPEAILMQAIDSRADQYAWGVMAYQLLAGAHPYSTMPSAGHGGPYEAALNGGAARLEVLAPDLPHSVCEAVERAMSTDAAKRFSDMAEIVEQLERQLRDSSGQLPDAAATPTQGERGPAPAPRDEVSTQATELPTVQESPARPAESKRAAAIVVGLLAAGALGSALWSGFPRRPSSAGLRDTPAGQHANSTPNEVPPGVPVMPSGVPSALAGSTLDAGPPTPEGDSGEDASRVRRARPTLAPQSPSTKQPQGSVAPPNPRWTSEQETLCVQQCVSARKPRSTCVAFCSPGGR